MSRVGTGSVSGNGSASASVSARVDDASHLQPPRSRATTPTPTALAGGVAGPISVHSSRSPSPSPAPGAAAAVAVASAIAGSIHIAETPADTPPTPRSRAQSTPFTGDLSPLPPRLAAIERNQEEQPDLVQSIEEQTNQDADQHAAILAALKLPRSPLEDIFRLHSPRYEFAPQVASGSSVVAADGEANGDGQADGEAGESSGVVAVPHVDGDGSDSDGDIEVEHKLFSKKAPLDESAGKGAAAATTTTPTDEAAAAMKVASAKAIRDQLDQLTKRGAPFGIDEHRALADHLRERAFSRTVTSSVVKSSTPISGVKVSTSPPADLDVNARRSLIGGNGDISAADVRHYFVTTPLIFQDAAPISPPQTNFQIHSKADDARDVFEQTVQALFMHAARMDFVRRERPLSPEQVDRLKAARADRKEKRRQRNHSISNATGIPHADSDSDDDIDHVESDLVSLSGESAARSGLPAVSPIDPTTNVELHSLLMTLEDAFGVSSRSTARAAEPFKQTVANTLALAQTTLRLHQSRLDSHPRYSSASFPSDTPVPLFNVFYSSENAFLNSRLNDIGESIAYEKEHARPHEQAEKQRRQADEKQKRASEISAASNQPTKRKTSFWHCCSSAPDEPDLHADSRMESRASVSVASAVDESVITRWGKTDFHTSFELLMRVLTQYEATIDFEAQQAEEAKRAAAADRANQNQRASVNDIDFNLIKHPDELAQEKLLSSSDALESDVDDRTKTVPIFTTRTLTDHRLGSISDNLRKILATFSETWRVGLPFSVGTSINLYTQNLNFNNPEWYSCVFNLLTMQATLFQAHEAIVARRGSRSVSRERQSGVTPIAVGGTATAPPFHPHMPTAVSIPFTNSELFDFKRQVRDMWEWIAIGFRRYQLTFARTVEDRACDEPTAGDEIPTDLDPMDGLKEALHLFIKVHTLMSQLSLPLSTAPGCQSNDPALFASSSSAAPEETLKSLIEAAIPTHYEDMVQSTRPTEIAPPPSPRSPAAILERPKILSALHLHKLIQRLTTEVAADSARARVFSEVLTVENGAKSNSFDLAHISHAAYFASLWVDARSFLVELSRQHTELTAARKSRYAKTIADIEAQLPAVLALYPTMREFHRLVSRSIPSPPEFNIASWFTPFVQLWLVKTREDWIGPSGAGGPAIGNVLSQSFDARIGPQDETPRRHSAAIEELFIQLRLLGLTLKDLPVSQADLETFAALIGQILQLYIQSLHPGLQALLDRESRKKTLWGMHVINGGDMVPALATEILVKTNDFYVLHGQISMLLDELDLKRMWLALLPASAVDPSESTRLEVHSPSQKREPDSPVLEAPELPTKLEKQASSAELQQQPQLSLGVPSPQPTQSPGEQDIPPAVLDVLDFRTAFQCQESALADLLSRFVSGLGTFMEQHIHMVVWKHVQGEDDEWSGRHTGAEIEPVFVYLRRHWDHMRVVLLDEVLCKLMFQLFSDLVLILETEMVHPKKQIYKNRLKTEQVHRVPPEYFARLKLSHLNRLESLETLLTGGSDSLVAEFQTIDPKVDEENMKLPFAARENFRLITPPFLSRRQLAGVIKAREELEGDHSSIVTTFIKQNKGGLFSANFFQ